MERIQAAIQKAKEQRTDADDHQDDGGDGDAGLIVSGAGASP